MEYMLMPDGTVTVHPKAEAMPQVHRCLSEHGGVAYYWLWKEVEWSMATLEDKLGRVTCDVPAVVLLAHALTQ